MSEAMLMGIALVMIIVMVLLLTLVVLYQKVAVLANNCRLQASTSKNTGGGESPPPPITTDPSPSKETPPPAQPVVVEPSCMQTTLTASDFRPVPELRNTFKTTITFRNPTRLNNVRVTEIAGPGIGRLALWYHTDVGYRQTYYNFGSPMVEIRFATPVAADDPRVLVTLPHNSRIVLGQEDLGSSGVRTRSLGVGNPENFSSLRINPGDYAEFGQSFNSRSAVTSIDVYMFIIGATDRVISETDPTNKTYVQIQAQACA